MICLDCNLDFDTTLNTDKASACNLCDKCCDTIILIQVNGITYTKEEFARLLKLKAFW
jgi:hypothetical protein